MGVIATIPSGYLAFLFTDVEGSTRLWERDPEGMASSLALHDAILRAHIDIRRGHVFSTAGDAFAASFPSVSAAAGAAIAIQRELAAAPWPGPDLRVRMGIHCGEAEERDGDYFGPVVNRTARISAAGNGGQTLLSSRAARELGDGNGLELHDLGTHRLKDLGTAEHIFEIRHPDLAVVTEPIQTAGQRRHNLPDYLNSFVGRTTELDELNELINGNRLVTLTGVGGTGKTRLAVELARRHAGERPDGAWLVQLAAVTHPQFIMTTIGEVWGLRPGEGATIAEVVTRYLRSRDLIVVIDNCEHLLDAASAAIKMLLDECPDLRVLVTSRESLGIPGEAILRVPSLSLTDHDGSLEGSDAMRLFLDRATAHRTDLDPTPDDIAAIGRACTRIDGIPLGLELAAARLRSMTAVELADRLETSFRILAGSAKAALPRQRTLHATIDWSYELLTPPEQALFKRLSVFTGGFDLASAEAVCAGQSVDRSEVLDHLDSLIDKSLVVAVPDESGHTRYRLLEPIRQYAQEELGSDGTSERYQLAHAHHFSDLVRDLAPRMRSRDIAATQRRIDLDYDNIRTALATFAETGNSTGYLDLAFDLYLYWMHKGMQVEAIGLARVVLDDPAHSTCWNTLAAVRVWWTTAVLAAELTDPVGVDFARSGLRIAASIDDPNAVGRMEIALGAAIRHATTDPSYLDHLERGRALLEANATPRWWDEPWDDIITQVLLAAYLPVEDDRVEEHLEAALDGLAEYGDIGLRGAMLSDGAAHYYFSGDRDRAFQYIEQAAEIYAELDSPHWSGHILQTWGVFLRFDGDHEQALERFTAAAPLLDTVGDAACWAASTRTAARCQAALGDVVGAARRALAVMDRLPGLPVPELTKIRSVDVAADVMLAGGDASQAAVLLGASAAYPFPEGTNLVRPKEVEEIREQVIARLGAAESDRLMAEGAGLRLDDALARAESALRSIAEE